MIVCICNVLTDKDIRAAADGGARTADAVYGHHGCERECGACSDLIDDFLEGPAASSAAPLPTKAAA